MTYMVFTFKQHAPNSIQCTHKIHNTFQIPDGMLNRIHHIIESFHEIEKDRIALHLRDEDGLRWRNLQRAPTSHLFKSEIIGREREKEELVDLLCTGCNNGEVTSVVAIVGTGGLGKTTLAQLTYNDKRIQQNFDKMVWLSVSEHFDVEQLTRASIESITGSPCDLSSLDALQNELSEKVRGKRLLLILDDVWNESKPLWEVFQAPFMSVALAKFLVTTRNDSVAKMMQTLPSFILGYLSEEQCWQLFQKYAFDDENQGKRFNMAMIGKAITKKCGMLPLAIKSIASLLRYEMDEESWREILESELWESDAVNEIFPPLQISYTNLSTYLKPCFLLCSMFPKGYQYNVEKLVQLWNVLGFIQSNNKMNVEEIGRSYAKQLWQRSFFEGEYGGKQFHKAKFKLHDMVHDLARFNSGNECYSIESDKVPSFSNEPRHLSIGDYVKISEPLPSAIFATLNTLIIGGLRGKYFDAFDFKIAKRLRVLELGSQVCDLETLFLGIELKHLRYLSLRNWHYERLPESMCSLYNLQNLPLSDYHNVQELPKSIGNLVSLEVLVIDVCPHLMRLPMSLCKLMALRKLFIAKCSQLEELPPGMGSLTNLQTLKISQIKIMSLPPGLSKFAGMQVSISCQAIGWLKDFSDLKGTLNLVGLNRMSGLDDARCANFVCMHNLESLQLRWSEPEHSDLHPYFDSEKGTYGNVLQLAIGMSFHQNTFLDDQNDLSLIEVLQPHSNLRELQIVDYSGSKLPNWIGNPRSCASLEKIVLLRCKNLTSLPFGRLRKLKFLEIYHCSSLQFLQENSLPPGLQQLEIYGCGELISLPGIRNLKSLVKITINGCRNLESLMMDAGSSVDLMMLPSPSYEKTVVGLSDFTSLRRLEIQQCPQLQLFAEDLPPKESCNIKIDWPILKEGGFQRSITYKDIVPNDEKQIVLRSAESSRMAENRLQSAQGRKKKKVAIRRFSSEFQKGEDVWLRVSPVKRSCHSRTARKQASRCIGPFKILHCIGGQKYKLALPATLSHQLDTEFHVSQLQKNLKSLSDTIDYSVLHLNKDLTYEVMPMRILNAKEMRLRNKYIRQVLVQWELHSEEEATWELEDEIHEKYPQLFVNSDRTGTVLDSEAEAEEGTSLK